MSGYVVFELENDAIFLHKEDAVHFLTQNSLWLDLNSSVSLPPYPGYSMIEARFDPDSHGHMGLYSGTLRYIQRIERQKFGGQQP